VWRREENEEEVFITNPSPPPPIPQFARPSQWAKATEAPSWYKAPWGFNQWQDKRLDSLRNNRLVRAYGAGYAAWGAVGGKRK
jgi:hypothetical protein